ncbi:hypothetical protein Pst134EA_009794 [Puccinia striiformis f. sp. tritici]|uniref:hypothetical protein n=1 Tax=Puccinia striiformis f. sp. tritici TaxID=168172 RepID=UPI002008C4EB|nr:hypothetical protein Pst134EA_009794 [Puccinia striiformis f. sp. tritici]KAH9469273.1 hypothetical protein Pst134EA_009794 [Puccinia striiformis f. sp. tritici]
MEIELIPKDAEWKRLRKEKKIERKKLEKENKRDRDQLEAEDKQSLEQEPSQTITTMTDNEHPSKQKAKPKSKRALDTVETPTDTQLPGEPEPQTKRRKVDPNPQTSASNTKKTTAPLAGAGNVIPLPTEPAMKPNPSPQEKKKERRKSKEKPRDDEYPTASSIQNNPEQIDQFTEPGSCPSDNPQTSVVPSTGADHSIPLTEASVVTAEAPIGKNRKERRKLKEKARDEEQSTALNVAINQDELDRPTEPQSCPSSNLQPSVVPDTSAPSTETSLQSASVTAVKKKNAPRKSKGTTLPEEQSNPSITANDNQPVEPQTSTRDTVPAVDPSAPTTAALQTPALTSTKKKQLKKPKAKSVTKEQSNPSAIVNEVQSAEPETSSTSKNGQTASTSLAGADNLEEATDKSKSSKKVKSKPGKSKEKDDQEVQSSVKAQDRVEGKSRSQGRGGEEDPELDRILIDSENMEILATKSHIPISLQKAIYHLTCRQILSSKWLGMSHLNELSTLFGLKYKKGRFTTTEQTTIEKMIGKYCDEHGLSKEEFAILLYQKKNDVSINERGKLKELAPSLGDALPGRPIMSIWKYVKRAYDPQSKLGRWTKEEELTLQEAQKKYGAAWTQISEVVGRSADDCKDRWRNYTCVQDVKNSGVWSQEEVDRLTELMNQSKYIFPDPKDQLSDGHWTWVSNQMGGSRSRSQCRIKWVECVQPKSLAGGKRRRWTNRDILILAKQLKKYNFTDDVVGFDWKQLRVGIKDWEVWDSSSLLRKWKSLKKYVLKKSLKEYKKTQKVYKKKSGLVSANDDGSTDLPPKNNQEIVDYVIKKWSARDESDLSAEVVAKTEKTKPTSDHDSESESGSELEEERPTPQSEIEAEPKSVTTGDCQPEDTAEEATDKSQPESITVDPVPTVTDNSIPVKPIPTTTNNVKSKIGSSLVTKSKPPLSAPKPKSGTGVKPRSLLLKEFTSAEFVDEDSS